MGAYKTKVEIVYDSLLDKVLRMEYKAGDRLIINQIAREHSVSDIPVREAIRRLETEGYVEIIANQGASVCSFSGEFLQELFMIKAVLEGYAARLSIGYLSAKDLAALRKINERIAAAAEANNTKKCAQLNVDFHMRIYQVVPGNLMHDMLSDLWRKYSITTSVFSVRLNRGLTSAAEHEEILRLLEKKDCDGVEQLMREHKLKAGRELLEALGQGEGSKLLEAK